MFFCAISGEPPQDPVISQKSGHVYERRLIQKYITENGTDPITGDKLDENDLLSVKASPNAAAPRPPAHSSIPALLGSLQTEWDALVLETFTLKQQYNSARQELSYALYAQDAASRVVARLTRERDMARQALASVQASMGVAPSASEGDVEMAEEGASQEGILPASIVAQIDATHTALTSTRKKRKMPPGFATPADVKTYKSTHTIPSLHSASAGITSIAVSTANPTQFLTGGSDNIVQLYDRSTDKVLASLKGHTKKVNRVCIRESDDQPTLLFSAGADKVARAWSHDSASGEYIPRSTIKTHKGEVTGLAVHPTNTLIALGSSDKTYSLHDLSNFSQVYHSPVLDDPFSSLSIHPDGAIMGLGTPNSSIHVYDIRSGDIAATLTPPDGAPFAVNTLCFSENGYHLAAPTSSSTVGIWDLRRQKIGSTINLGEGFNINQVVYDYSAQILGVAGSEGIRVFAHKTWEELARFEEGGEATTLAFGAESKEIWGTTGREVRIWGAPA
ncbi:WD40 repeat-like protein [Stereum hirsutum FP-91666 SS1]|uniref:WD40 repeat-like protein n=1 Tax=Stereum hirsutum (strain FP-91666) TaxID=721885 RepID=UPI000440F025|nr:WD40 repeat-like protein [Stereum hirsutum FP-91666 SS1]EIM92935.1 WD40 repeat-like protein [Stereum hirsutum FP-91666 SS1]